MATPACPICHGERFEDYNGRSKVRCVGCGSLERGRYQWLVLGRCVVLERGAVVGHFAPEAFYMDRFARLPGVVYHAFDKYPEHYAHGSVDVRRLDLCTDLEALPERSFDLVIHNHVLEHLPCAFGPVLAGLARLLKPGGVMLFSVPIDGELTREGLDPASTPFERELRARQGEHLRVFGKRDFARIVEEILGADCLLRQSDHFTQEELAAANVPIARRGEPTGKSAFLYRRT
jgi:SAM-dependent methyltransferase